LVEALRYGLGSYAICELLSVSILQETVSSFENAYQLAADVFRWYLYKPRQNIVYAGAELTRPYRSA
jgi:hypothetical protein